MSCPLIAPCVVILDKAKRLPCRGGCLGTLSRATVPRRRKEPHERNAQHLGEVARLAEQWDSALQHIRNSSDHQRCRQDRSNREHRPRTSRTGDDHEETDRVGDAERSEMPEVVRRCPLLGSQQQRREGKADDLNGDHPQHGSNRTPTAETIEQRVLLDHPRGEIGHGARRVNSKRHAHRLDLAGPGPASGARPKVRVKDPGVHPRILTIQTSRDRLTPLLAVHC